MLNNSSLPSPASPASPAPPAYPNRIGMRRVALTMPTNAAINSWAKKLILP
ncbi:MAG: hypothetical protein KME55_40755 [Nostoc indistinguendum CM1-VF10]|nr:hypothetical protein [Nostoc indistinguendum CM1-VF10]